MAVSTIKSTPIVVELANNAVLLKEGRKMTLMLNNFVVGSATLTIPTADRPSENIGTVALRRASAANGSSLGFIRVLASTGAIDIFYAPTYGDSVSNARSGDLIAGQLSWVI